MRETFDRRVIPEQILAFVRACQARIPCQLGGGAALSGAYLAHRTTGDIDLFISDADDMRALAARLPEVASEARVAIQILRDVGHLVRARIETPEGLSTEVDVVHDPGFEIEAPPDPVEGIIVKALADLRASKLTCILSRSEPRDLVDLFFLERAGYPPENDLDLAAQKDAGIDPGVLAWLLAHFPLRPLPNMLEPLTEEQLRKFRNVLAERLRHGAIGAT